MRVVVCAAIIIRPIGPFLFQSGYTNQSKWSQSVSISQKGKTVPSVSLGWYPPRKKHAPVSSPQMFLPFLYISTYTLLLRVFSLVTFQKSRVFLLDFPNGNGVGGRNFAIHLLPAATYLFEMTRVSIYAWVCRIYRPAWKKPRYRCTTRRVDWLDLFRWYVPSPRDI